MASNTPRLAITGFALIAFLVLASALRWGFQGHFSNAGHDRSGEAAEHRYGRGTRVSSLSETGESRPRSASAAPRLQRTQAGALPDAVRVTSGPLTSATTNTLFGFSPPLKQDENETTEVRHARWKSLGLQLVPVHIVDVTSAPIENARVQLDGVHYGQQGKNTAHGGWYDQKYGPAPADTTNSDGRAWLAAPVMLTDLEECSGVSFNASKPGYASRRIFEYPVDGSERDEVLKRGNTLIVAAYVGSPANRVANFTPRLGFEAQIHAEDWKPAGDGRLMTEKLPDGKFPLTVDGQETPVLHSDVVSVEVRGGVTKEVELELKAALTLHGRLSDNVPRPVTGGKVRVSCQSPEVDSSRSHGGRSSLDRQEETLVAEDGSFEIPSLPAGPGEIIGLCDGYVAAHRTPDAKVYEQNQRFELRPDSVPIILEMEPAAILRVKTVDASGQPLAGVKISTSPNVLWATGMSTIYLGDLWNATTGPDGVAEIRNMPAGRQFYEVWSEKWEYPAKPDGNGRVSRSSRIQLTSGQTTNVTLTLQPKAESEP